MVARCVNFFAEKFYSSLRADAFDASKYERHFDIKFAGYTGTETLTDFPALIRVSKAINDFKYDECKVANGGDLRFSDANGVLLQSEVERWNPAGESLVWVKVPSLTKDTLITAHYGSSNPDAVTPTAVWDSHYLGVWHMGAAEGSTTQADSTANGKDFGIETAYADGIATGQDGVAGLASAFHQREDGKGCYYQADSSGHFAGFTAFTLEAWTYQDNHEVGSLTTDSDLPAEGLQEVGARLRACRPPLQRRVGLGAGPFPVHAQHRMDEPVQYRILGDLERTRPLGDR